MRRGAFVFFLSCLFCLIFIPPAYPKKPSLSKAKIKLSSSNTKLQLILQVSGNFHYKSFLLPAKKGPKRLLVIDIWPVYLPEVRKNIRVNSHHVRRIKVSQYNKRTVRAVAEFTRMPTYSIKKNRRNLILTIQSPKPHKKICIRKVKVNYPTEGIRITIKTSGRPHYKDFILPKVSSKRLPPRLVIDLWPAYLPKGAKKRIKINHPLASRLRIAQFNKQIVRVVLSLRKTNTPYWVNFKENCLILTAFITAPQKSPFLLPQVLGLKIRRIVIDPGHGGRDPGAIGYRGLREKDITLKLAKLLRQKLKASLKCEVILTRYRDAYVSLERRVALANKLKADLFISLHCNACPDHHLQGIETYFVGLTNDKRALAVAARENASLNRRRGELDKILLDLLAKAKIKESAYLAAEIQKNLIRHIKATGYNPIKDLGVRQAPFYVLIGTSMPAVLIETGFIDNYREAKRLCNQNYLNTVAEGILKGIKSYIRTIEAYRSTPIGAEKGDNSPTILYALACYKE
ncbi:MAG: N-acetylmuramoyl-L-alanine amidase [Deltaproteobacteria bacterium]|nr:N-acetylmuramoyl-L-alanine amidase [Deltaproteobacteria bacterium]